MVAPDPSTAPDPPVIEIALLGVVKFDPDIAESDVDPAAVTRPFASTVKLGMVVDVPYDPGVTVVFESVSVVPVPSTDPVPPVIAISAVVEVRFDPDNEESDVRRQEAVAEAMKNATALEKGWEFEERSDRDADR
jgi:hypothetical protein